MSNATGGPLTSLAEARAYVLEGLAPLAPVETALAEVAGTVAGETVRARDPSPRFVNSSMDGFAVRAADTRDGGASLTLVDSVFAGDESTRALREGEAIRIMTGAPLPEGADSVAMREVTSLDASGHRVFIERVVTHGESVRHVGEDVKIGDVLVEAGQVLSAAHVGVLANQGYDRVLTHRRPLVGVLSTGNELVDAPGELAPGKIRDSNRPALLALIRQSGFNAVDLGVAGDRPEEISGAFREALAHCDAIVSSGGVSVGDADFVKSVLQEICGDRSRSLRVAIKPGKPFAYGRAPGGAPLFALAGNPVSTLVGFELYVRPALRRLGGHRHLERRTVWAVLDEPLTRRRDGRLHLIHATCGFGEDGRCHVLATSRQASHLLHAVAGANALLLVPDGESLDAGERVVALLLDSFADGNDTVGNLP